MTVTVEVHVEFRPKGIETAFVSDYLHPEERVGFDRLDELFLEGLGAIVGEIVRVTDVYGRGCFDYLFWVLIIV